MPDPRFFEDLGPVGLGELASLTGAQAPPAEAAARTMQAVATLARAEAQDVAFLADKRHLAEARATRAGACFVTPDLAPELPAGCAPLLTPRPQLAYAVAAGRLHRPRRGGVMAQAGDEAFEGEVELGPGVVVGPGARIGAGTLIGANTVIGPGVAIGRNCEIGSNVTIGFSLIGDRVRVLAGAVIGEPGFGATSGPNGPVDIPQLGRVIIQDGVTIGANTTVDRGAFEDTVIGENSKIDNLVQIAHNVRIGRNCVMAAFTGISGSAMIGDGAAFGGRAGVADHVMVGEGARIGAAAAVMKDVPAGETWSGAPARPIRRWMRETAWIARMVARGEGGDV